MGEVLFSCDCRNMQERANNLPHASPHSHPWPVLAFLVQKSKQGHARMQCLMGGGGSGVPNEVQLPYHSSEWLINSKAN